MPRPGVPPAVADSLPPRESGGSGGRGFALAAVLLCALACPQAEEPEAGSPAESATEASGLSRDAKPATHEALLEDDRAPRHPSDGGGRAWIEALTLPPGIDRLRAGGRARFDLVYEAGPLGIIDGGRLFLQTSPFWGWDTPQTQAAEGPGYTEVSTEAAEIELETETPGRHLLAIQILGRALAEGERISIRFGAGEQWARVDRFAERDERLWVAVDGDGDGVRKLLADSPRVEIAAGPPARLVLRAPSVVRPGDPFAVKVALLDGRANHAVDFEGTIELVDVPDELSHSGPLELAAGGRGAGEFSVTAQSEGVYRLSARAKIADEPVEAVSDPIVASASAPKLLWADLHGHSQLSDGTGTPDDFFRYARDVAGLDVVALTDHDHWGMLFLDRNPELWSEIREATARFHSPGPGPGRFVTLPGFEWTSWLHGHRHVLFFEEDAALISSISPETERPDQLWDALAGRAALTFAHHSAGGPISTNWKYRPDPLIEPVTEVVSVHGSSEALDSPGRIYSPVEGNFVRDVLDEGMRFGFIGSGDSHDGHPGMAHLGAASGGVAAIFAEEHTREAVLEALRKRRCYATNGPRIWLRFALDGRPMGSILSVSDATSQQLDVAVVSPGPLDRVEIVRSGVLLDPHVLDGERSFSGLLDLPRLESGEYIYLRVFQRDGGAAWSSPIFVE